MGTNARALRSIVEKVMTPVMFKLADLDQRCVHVVDAGVIRGGKLKAVRASGGYLKAMG